MNVRINAEKSSGDVLAEARSVSCSPPPTTARERRVGQNAHSIITVRAAAAARRVVARSR